LLTELRSINLHVPTVAMGYKLDLRRLVASFSCSHALLVTSSSSLTAAAMQ
jgi:hypothetical protein